MALSTAGDREILQNLSRKLDKELRLARVKDIVKMKHAGNIQPDGQLDLDRQLAGDLDRELDRQLDPVSVGTVLLSLAALSMAVAAYLLG